MSLFQRWFGFVSVFRLSKKTIKCTLDNITSSTWKRRYNFRLIITSNFRRKISQRSIQIPGYLSWFPFLIFIIKGRKEIPLTGNRAKRQKKNENKIFVIFWKKNWTRKATKHEPPADIYKKFVVYIRNYDCAVQQCKYLYELTQSQWSSIIYLLRSIIGQVLQFQCVVSLHKNNL